MKRIFILALMLLGAYSAKSQIGWFTQTGATTSVIDLNACSDSTYTIFILNPTGNALTNCVLDVQLPTGVTYIGSSVTETTTGGAPNGLPKTVVENNVANLSHPYFSFNDLPANGGYVSFTYRVHASCGTPTNSVNVPIMLSYTAGGVAGTSSPNNTGSGLNTVNINKASLNIISSTNQNMNTGVGTSYQQTITLRNAGLGFLDGSEDDLVVKVHLDETSCLTITAPDKGTLVGDTLFLPKALFSTIGNNNDRWENNEDLSVTYTVTVNCCDNLTRNVQAIWGCDLQSCETSSAFPSNVIIPNLVPNLITNATGLLSTDICHDGTNGLGNGAPVLQQFRIINTGTGAATNLHFDMLNYASGSGTGNNYFDTAVAWTVRDASGTAIGVTSNPSVLAGGAYNRPGAAADGCGSALTMNRVGWDIVGLALPAGDTFIVDVPTYYENESGQCRTGCATSITGHYFTTNLAYTGQCGSPNYTDLHRRLGTNGRHLITYSTEMPTDLSDQEPFDLKIDYSRFYSNWARSSGALRFYVDLTGTDVVYDGTGNSLVNSTQQSWGHMDTWVANDTLWVDLPTGRAGGWSYTIPMKFICGTGGTKTFRMGHYVTYDTTTCGGFTNGNYRSYCQNKTFVGHCPAPCPTGGATPVNFSLERINIDPYDDNNNGVPSGTLDMSKVDVHHAFNGDTLLGSWNINVYPNVEPANPNVGMPFPYTFLEFDLGSPSGSNNLASTALTALPNAELVIYPNGGGAPISCLVTPTVVGQIATYDFNSCKTSWVGGDSIVFNAKYIANSSLQNTGRKDFVSNNHVYSSYILNAADNSYATQDSINGQRHTCDHYNDYMVIYNVYNSLWTPTGQVINGCSNNLLVYYRRYIENQSGDVRFPYEVRSFEVPDNYSVRLSSDFNYRPGSARLSGTVIPDAQVSQQGDYFIFTNLKSLFVDYGGTRAMNDENWSYSLSFRVDPTCDAVPGTSTPIRFNGGVAGNGLNSPAAWNAAIDVPGGTGDSSGAPGVAYNAPLQFASGGGTVSTVNDTAAWQLTLNNGSNSVDAPDSWYYIETLAGTPMSNITVSQGGTTLTQNAAGFYELGDNNASNSTLYDIVGNINDCDTVKLLVHTGWGCTGYPVAWLPNNLCYETDTLIVYSYPAGTDANLQVNWTAANNTVNFCAPFSLELVMNSTQLGDLSTLVNNWLIPFAYTVDLPNVQIEYPKSSGLRAPSNPAALVQNGQLLNIDYNNLDALLTDGISGSYDTLEKELKVLIPFNSGCGAFSGDVITAIYNATTSCGDVLPEILKETSPLVFAQAAIPGYTTSPSGRTDTIIGCDGVTDYNFYVEVPINTINTTSQIGDSIFVTLPPGVDFNSYAYNAPGQQFQPIGTAQGPVDVGNGRFRYSFPMTGGLTTGDTIKFQFKFNFDYNDFEACNQILRSFIVTTGGSTAVTCNGVSCTIQSINGRGTADIQVKLPEVSATIDMGAQCLYNAQTSTYNVTADIDICNAGDVATTGQTTVEVYCDANNNGFFDMGIDNLITVVSTTQVIPANGCVTIGNQTLAYTDFNCASGQLLTVVRRDPSPYGPEQCVCIPVQSNAWMCDPQPNSVIAQPDNNSTWENTPVSGEVLTNDWDPQGHPFSFNYPLDQTTGNPVAVGTPFQVSGTDMDGNPVANAGTITFAPDGSYTFNPAAGFNGQVNVPYQISDAAIPQATDISVLTINVLPVPTPDGPNTPGGVGALANNDQQYTPHNTPTDGDISVNDINPYGLNQDITVVTDEMGNPIPFGVATPVPGVDANGNPVANAGTIIMNADGTWDFTPTNGFIGDVDIPYTVEVNDPSAPGQNPEASAVLNIVVGPPGTGTSTPPGWPNPTGPEGPSATDDFGTTLTNTPNNPFQYTIPMDMSSNDEMVAGHTYSYHIPAQTGVTSTTPPAGWTGPTTGLFYKTPNGTVANFDTATGTYTWIPDVGYVGPDQFSYNRVDLTTGLSAQATEYFLVSPQDNNVFAQPDNNVTWQDTDVSGGVLQNDWDPQGDIVSFGVPIDPVTGLAAPVGTPISVPGTDQDGNPVANAGTITFAADGTYTYDPEPAFLGQVNIPYTVLDDGTPQATDTTILTITVLPEPSDTLNPDDIGALANNDQQYTPHNTPTAGDVSVNDINPYNANQDIIDVRDQLGNPITPGTPVNVPGTDMNGRPVDSAGTLIFNPDGSWSFIPTNGFVGTVDVPYTVEVNDPLAPNADAQASAVLQITVGPDGTGSNPAPGWPNPNGPEGPSATDDFGSTKTNTAANPYQYQIPMDMSANDEMVPGRTYIYNVIPQAGVTELTSPPAGWTGATSGQFFTTPNGTIANFDSTTGTYTWIPNVGYVGPDQFTYNRTDQTTGLSAQATEYFTAYPESFIPLPVTILGFNGTMREDGSNLLTWTVEQEVNLAGYELERSEDNKNFTKIASTTALNTSSRHTYKHTDAEPPLESFYRLKVKDIDGKVRYSKIVRLKRSLLDNADAFIFPNPAQSELSFVYKSTEDDVQLYVEILDATGRMVMKKDEIVNSGSTTMSFDVSSLANGNYILRYNNVEAGTSGFVKFTKTNK